ncbi:MAG: 1-acyl-sn-glycerol-3-phosphate acyltransferase [Deltaproteobacteria bacterium]|nr:1-acyl-sn-glycerol-3-phosphate acyltransferase [Deltaproteobacteria bacterium]
MSKDERTIVAERVAALESRVNGLMEARRARVTGGKRGARSSSAGSAEIEATRERLAKELAGLAARLEKFERADEERGRKSKDGSGSLSSFREVVRQARRLGDAEEIDDFGLDRGFFETVRPLVDLLYDRYFRVEAEGAKANVPAEGPAILVANRGGPVAYDALMIAEAARRAHPGRRIRFHVDPHLGSAPGIGPIMVRLGGVKEAGDNAERLVEEGQLFLFFPEGFRGAVKTLGERYRLAEFSTEFAEAAERLGVPVIPVALIGSEEAQPVIGGITFLARALGWPAFPLAPLGVLPLPVKFRIRFGKPLTPSGARGRALKTRARALRQRTRDSVQASLRDLLASRRSVFLG